MTAPRRSLLFWITPPVFALVVASWSVEHRLPSDPRWTGGHPPSAGRARGEELPLGTAEIFGTITAPDGGLGSGEVEIALAREDWLAEHNPASWRCCETCGYGLFDEYCDRGASMVQRLDARDRLDVAPSRVTGTQGGRFSFLGLPAGRYAIWGATPGGTIAVARDVIAGDHERRELTLRSLYRGSITGTVLSAADGGPAAGATVVAIDPRIGKVHRSTAGEDGAFEVHDLDPEVAYFVAAWGDGLAPAGRAIASPGDELALELEDAGAIGGTVTLNGKPLSGVTVDLDEIVDAAVTDVHGKFRFEGLAPGMHLVRAATDGGLGQRLEIELPRGLSRKLELQLARVCNLIVEVRDRDGALAGADVRMFAKGSIDHRVERTDELGTAVFEMLPLGSYDLEARRSDRGGTSRAVRLGNKCTTRTERVHITSTAGVRGRVVDEREQPIAGADITLQLGTGDTGDDVPRTTRTNEKGRFQIPSLGAGPWELTASKPGFISSVTAFEMIDAENDVDLEVALSAGGTIAGRLVDPSGAPVAGWLIYARPPDDGDGEDLLIEAALGQPSNTGEDGSFSLYGLRPGEYVLEAQPAPSSARFAIESAETHAPPVKARTGDREVVIVTRGTGMLSGTVAFAGGPAPESFSVGVPGLGVRSFDGRTGRFVFDGAIAASYPILFHARGFSNAVVRVTVERDRDTNFTVNMHASARLEGRVTDARDGRPISDATVIAVSPGDDKEAHGYPSTASSRRDGVFDLRDLEPGEYVLHIQADGYARVRVGPFTVAASRRAPAIDVRLERASVRVTGRVHRRGNPLADAVLMLRLQEPKDAIGLVENARTSARGAFVFDSVEPGTHLLTVAARPGGATGVTIIHRQVLTVPVAGVEALEIDVDDHGPRSGRQKLAVEVSGNKRETLLVTLRPTDGETVPRGGIEASRVLENGRREVVFDRLAPGAYTVTVGQLEAPDSSVLGYAIAGVRPLVTRQVDVRDRGPTRVSITAE